MIPNPDKKNKKKDKRIPTDKLIELVHSAISKPDIRNKVYYIYIYLINIRASF